MVEFDLRKDAANIVKHGISLARAIDLEVLAMVPDLRFAEARFRAYGLIDSVPHCLAFTMRGRTIRAISLRRARVKETKRYVPQAGG